MTPRRARCAACSAASAIGSLCAASPSAPAARRPVSRRSCCLDRARDSRATGWLSARLSAHAGDRRPQAVIMTFDCTAGQSIPIHRRPPDSATRHARPALLNTGWCGSHTGVQRSPSPRRLRPSIIKDIGGLAADIPALCAMITPVIVNVSGRCFGDKRRRGDSTALRRCR
jgi:hypothetical protein